MPTEMAGVWYAHSLVLLLTGKMLLTWIHTRALPLGRLGLMLIWGHMFGRDDVEQWTAPPLDAWRGSLPHPAIPLGIAMSYRLQRGPVPSNDSVTDPTSALFAILAGGYSSRERGPNCWVLLAFPLLPSSCIHLVNTQ